MQRHLAVVVKLGGSLLGTPRLVPRLQEWVASQGERLVVFVVGGGPPVRALRAMRLGEEEAHWASIAVMRQHAIRLAAQYPRGRLVESWAAVQEAWQRQEQPFFEVSGLLKQDEAEPDHLPHSWEVTSDSIAARVAARHAAGLVLLKACPASAGPYDWDNLSQQGIVDGWFPRVAPTVAEITVGNLPE